MSGHLTVVAGYMDLPLSHKLALMKFCDSADDQTRLAFPGLDAVRLWAGVKKSRGLDITAELQESGLLMQVEAGHRGKRAVFKVFPSPGDEAFSLAHKQGKPCPGAEKFVGPPGVPNVEEVKARIAGLDAEKGPWNGSGAADPKRKGPALRTQSEGSAGSDPIDEERVRPDDGKGPAGRQIGSGAPDPFLPELPVVPTSSLRPPPSAGDEQSSGLGKAKPEAPRPDVEALCVLLADLVKANGSKRPPITKTWRTECRRMLDIDKRDPAKAEALIRWCQADSFWRSNVLSMPTFRQKYDQLRLKALAEWEEQQNPTPNRAAAPGGGIARINSHFRTPGASFGMPGQEETPR